MNDPCTSFLRGKGTHILRHMPCKVFQMHFGEHEQLSAGYVSQHKPCAPSLNHSSFLQGKVSPMQTHIGLFLTSDPKELQNFFSSLQMRATFPYKISNCARNWSDIFESFSLVIFFLYSCLLHLLPTHPRPAFGLWRATISSILLRS